MDNNSNPGPSDIPSQQSGTTDKIIKWTREDYRFVLYAYYYALEKPYDTSFTARAYEIWRSNNNDIRTYIDASRLVNISRDIIKHKRLTDIQSDLIEEQIKKYITIENEENTAEAPNVSKDLPSTIAASNSIRQIIESKDIYAKETNETEAEQITIEKMSQEMSENLDSITPNFQTTEVEIMSRDVLMELAIIQNIETTTRKRLHNIQCDKNSKLKVKPGNSPLIEISIVRKPNLNELSNLIYATAKLVTDECTGSKKRKDNERRKPIWKEKIEKEIEQIREDLSIISELQTGINVKGRKFRKMSKIYKLTKEHIAPVKERIKQKMQLKA